MSNVTKLPTAPTSFFTVRKTRNLFTVQLVTPVGEKNLRTSLARFSDRQEAIAYAEQVSRQRQRPLKIGRGRDRA